MLATWTPFYFHLNVILVLISFHCLVLPGYLQHGLAKDEVVATVLLWKTRTACQVHLQMKWIQRCCHYANLACLVPFLQPCPQPSIASLLQKDCHLYDRVNLHQRPRQKFSQCPDFRTPVGRFHRGWCHLNHFLNFPQTGHNGVFYAHRSKLRMLFLHVWMHPSHWVLCSYLGVL